MIFILKNKQWRLAAQPTAFAIHRRSSANVTALIAGAEHRPVMVSKQSDGWGFRLRRCMPGNIDGVSFRRYGLACQESPQKPAMKHS